MTQEHVHSSYNLYAGRLVVCVLVGLGSSDCLFQTMLSKAVGNVPTGFLPVLLGVFFFFFIFLVIP